MITPLKRTHQYLLTLVSFVLVAFGQPAWCWWCGLIAAAVGYALFCRVLLCYPNWKTRFYLAIGWFAAVQLLQLSWFLSHPYYYIYSVYLFLSLILGIQFGIIALFITPKRISQISSLIAIASLWTIFEWMRLFLLSGFSFNPIGLALAGSTFSLQMASLWGVFGLSFWVMFVNLLGLRAWCFQSNTASKVIWGAAVAFPYIYGGTHYFIHDQAMAKNAIPFQTVLMQTAFPLEEQMSITNSQQLVAVAQDEWEKILKMVQKHKGKQIDLVVFPEIVVPFSAYSCVYSQDVVKAAFSDILGHEGLQALPHSSSPFALNMTTPEGDQRCFVNNAYWSQAVANYLQAGILIGLEDVESHENKMHLYSSALYFQPQKNKNIVLHPPAARYDKRILVPMGEYIPFDWCQTLAASYGVFGSFKCGTEAKVFKANEIPFGVSICYDETFGDIMRDNKHKGAALIANLTNDAWYPTLPWQHFEHSRLRTVENGVSLIRACNTGITGGIDSLGRNISVLKEETPDSLHLEVPIYTYPTLYSWLGDRFIIGLSFLGILLFFRRWQTM
jgi:apolipoprotein N-acyltransferase